MQKFRALFIAMMFGMMLLPTASFAEDDLRTELPPPPNDFRSPTSEGITENPDGSFTFTQIIDENSTSPHYVSPGSYGFEIYSFYNEDYGWMHTFPYWNDANLLINEAKLTIVAWDVDSETYHGYDGEYDGIHVDGTLLDPGYLQGNNGQWSVTEFNLQMSSIIDDGDINVWCDIDMHHNERWWATTIDYCELQITFTLSGTNTAPYEPDLVVYPECAGNEDDLTVQITGPDPADPNGDTVTYQYEWFVDVGTGEYIEDVFAGRGEHDDPVVPAADTVFGDLWRVQVRSIDVHGTIGNYSTVTWDNPIGCIASDLVILDARPASLGTSFVDQSVLPEEFATGGIECDQCVTDGTSRLFFRYTSDRPGTLNLQLYDAFYTDLSLGTLSPLNSTVEGVATSANTYETSEGHQAFVVYRPPGSLFLTQDENANSREIRVSLVFNPTDGTPPIVVDSAVYLQRPPVVFVHGIWSDSDKWTDSGLYDAMIERLGTEVAYVDYGGRTHLGFNTLYPVVKSRATTLISGYQQRGIACTQVQVVAHSMGGLLTRIWMAEDDFYSADSFREGAVDMLVTIDTPHWGSGFANYYSGMNTPETDRCFKFMNFVRDYGESVINLETGSTAISDMGHSRTRAHAFVGIGGTDSYHDASGRTSWLGELQEHWPSCFEGLLPELIFGEGVDHDFIVQRPSQEGGLSSPLISVQTGVAGEHTEAPDDPGVATKVERILELGNSSNIITENGFPAVDSSNTVVMVPGGAGGTVPPLVSVDPAAGPRAGEITILSPAAGSIWTEGSAVTIQADFGQPVIFGLALIDDDIFVDLDPVTGEGTWIPEPGTIGIFSIKAFAAGDDDVYTSHPHDFTILPASPFVGFHLVTPHLVTLRPGETSHIIVTGETASGEHINVSAGSMGTTYEVGNSSIALVDSDGLITAAGPGTTTIIVRNGSSFEETVEFRVLYAVPNDPPVAVIGGPYETCVGEPLCLDGTGSYDIDGTPTENLGFEWDLDGDGFFDEATGGVPCVELLSAGEVTISLRVTDTYGAESIASTTLTGLNCGPVIDDADPIEPSPGDQMEIRGRLFGLDPGVGARSTDTHNVSLAGHRLADEAVLSWDDRGIVVQLPLSAVSGALVVTVDSVPSAPFNLVVAGGGISCLWASPSMPALEVGGSTYGLAWGDYDNDSYQDLFVTRDGRDLLYHNDGGVSFTLVDETLGSEGDTRTASWADYDNDGDLDLYVVVDEDSNKLYNNDGGTFTDVTVGPEGDAGDGYTATWGDVDQDGDLDLFIANAGGFSRLLLNENGTFVESAELAPIEGVIRSCTFADYDNDGDLDLYVGMYGPENKLFNNEGGGQFSEITGTVLNCLGRTKGIAWGDYDNDGDLDLYVVNNADPNYFFRNDLAGGFVDVTVPLLADDGEGRSCVWTDYDNDGWLDLLVTNVDSTPHLYRNLQDGDFEETTCGDLAAYTGQSWSCGFADYDNDGDQDLFLTDRDYSGVNKLFENQLVTRSYLKVSLQGTVSNRYGVGARVIVHDGLQSKMRDMTGNSGYLTSSPLSLIVGLGSAQRVDVEVRWPSGIVQLIEQVNANSTIIIVEELGASGVEEIVAPMQFKIANWPNPFNPSTTISFALPQPSKVSLKIYDVQGKLVRVLCQSESYDAGSHALQWHGRDSAGHIVPSGVYFYRLGAGEYTGAGRMMLLK